MLGTLIRRVTVRTLDTVVERGRASSRSPMRLAAGALDKARQVVGLDAVARDAPLPNWTAETPERPMWDSDRRKMRKWQIERGIVKDAEQDEETGVEPAAQEERALRVFFKRGCPYSRATFDLLREREVEFEPVDVTGDEQMLSWLKITTGKRTTPQIFIHGEHVGGYDQLRALDLDGELTRRVEQPSAEAAEEPEQEAKEITVQELQERIEDGMPVLLLDVRGDNELATGVLEGAVHMPMHALPQRASELDAEGVWIAYCSTGKRSLAAADQLQALGFRSVVSLRGGIAAWLAAGGEAVAKADNAPRKRVSLRVVHPERSPFEDLMDEWNGQAAEHLEDDELVAKVREVLDECRPMVQADGGDIELLDVQGDVVHVQLTGNCVGCPSSQATLRQGIERRLKTRIPQITGIASPQLQ